MFSWITIDDVTPSGLKLNRAWHAKQIVSIIFPVFCIIIVSESLFGSKYRKIIQQRRIFYDKMKDKVYYSHIVSGSNLQHVVIHIGLCHRTIQRFTH